MPICICPADFNGDGNIDVAVGNGSSGSISVFLGNGAGSFGAPTHFATATSDPEPQSLAVFDFNGDGILDLATTHYTTYTNNVSVLFGTGTGGFAPAVGYTIGGPGSGYTAHGIVSADFNGDGLLDLGTIGGPIVSIFLNSGGGNFGTAAYYASGAFGTKMITADFNNDGKADLVTNDTGGVCLLLGTGTGSFGAFAYYPTLGNNWPMNGNGLCSADFNSDGNIDLAIPNLDMNNVAILLGNGAGSFATPICYPTIGLSPLHITTTDFDGDCNLDLAVEMDNSQSVEIFPGNGNGTFNTSTSFYIGYGPVGICTADFNGDHKPDLALPATQRVMSVLNCSIDYCTTGLTETTNKRDFSIYPNPATDKINLKLTENASKAKVIIQNSLGQIVKQQLFSESIDISDLAKGIYLVKVDLVGCESFQSSLIKQ